jgi:hypothetical protein
MPRWPWIESAFAKALVIAFVLHLPFFPTRVFDWLRLVLSSGGDYDDRDAQAIVPIDLDLLAKDPVPESPPEPPAPEPPATSAEPALDAGAPPEKKREPKAPPDGGAPDAGPQAPAPLKDPLSAAGGAGKVAAKDPNVQILLSGRVLRRYPIGAWASEMLVMIPEWRAFFAETGIDPIRDLDHLLISSPRLKGDTSNLVAVLGMNVSSDAMWNAVDGLLHRTNGVWIEDAPVRAARAKVLGAPRLFALVPDRKLLFVMPADKEGELVRLKQSKGFRNSAEGAMVSLLTPSRPFKDFLPLPESLKWMRLALTPTADGGADLALDAGDRSSEEAQKHAEELTREIEARRKVNILGFQVEVIDAVTFQSTGELIQGRTHLTAAQLGRITGTVEQNLRARFGRAAPAR